VSVEVNISTRFIPNSFTAAPMAGGSSEKQKGGQATEDLRFDTLAPNKEQLLSLAGALYCSQRNRQTTHI
jgi:hypothetical protein